MDILESKTHWMTFAMDSLYQMTDSWCQARIDDMMY